MSSKHVFVGREKHIARINDFLDVKKPSRARRRLVVSGDSGVGKSHLVKEAVFRYLNNKDYFILYADLSNDEFQSSRLISSFLNMSLVSFSSDVTNPTNIPAGYSLKDYRDSIQGLSAKGWDALKGISQAIATSFGLGGAANTALQSFGNMPVTPDEILGKYLSWVTKGHELIIIVDNYQFINYEVRMQLESIIQSLDPIVRFIIVERTVNGASELNPPMHKNENYDFIYLENLSEIETQNIISLYTGETDEYLKKLSSDIYTKTNGNAKDVEYCIKKYQLDSEGSGRCDIRSLLATIHRLPLMHRQILLIASMLDGGIHKDIAKGVIKRVCISEEEEIDQALSKLLFLQYLKINSDTGVRLRAGHERIIQVMRELDDDEIFDDVRRGVVAEFYNLIDRNSSSEDSSYLLHCLVGLQTAIELKNNLHLVSRLIREQYRDEQFPYIVNLSDEAQDIISYLPQDVINIILDSMQKTSSFEKGLVLVRKIGGDKAVSEDDLNISRYKFLSQLYNYEEAEKVANVLPESKWSILYRTNMLLALEKDKEAKRIIDSEVCYPANSEEDAVLLRNTITLFGTEEALKNLKESEMYFKRTGGEFRAATVNTNMGLVYICQKNYGDASWILNQAIELMTRVGSREIFQAKFNLSILWGVAGEKEQCINGLEESLEYVPNALILDEVKIKMAITIFKFTSQCCNKLQAIGELEGLLNSIKGIDLPYLRKSLQYNIYILNELYDEACSMNIRFASKAQVSLYLPVENKELPLIINPSIHWRY